MAGSGSESRNDTDSEQVIDTFKRSLLLLNLVPDGMDGFGTSLDVELQSGFLYLLLDRIDERSDILVAGCFRLVELLLYKVVGSRCVYFSDKSSNSDFSL